jgi:polyisoprenoid-binding protein YceI
MKKIIHCVIIASTIWIFSNQLYAQNFLEMTNSKIEFVIKNAGMSVEGSFSGLEMDVEFDAERRPTKIKAFVKSKTIDTNNNMRDNHLRKEEYFDVEKYPHIIMESISIKNLGKNKFEGLFKLTIKNTNREVSIPFSFVNNTFEGNFSLNRLDYEVGTSSWILSDNVKIKINATIK